LKASRDKVLKALADSAAAPCDIAPGGMRIAAGEGPSRQPNVTVEPAYQKGWFEVQDEGSQIAALLAAAPAGGNVLDLCAGGGGKTLAMAAAMENKGQIHAFDAGKSRLAPIFERLRRAGTRNVQVHANRNELVALENRMDLVLVDAPCTGTGTWRRRPDTKWKLTPESLGLRVNEQRSVLAEARRYVRPGGRLAYITCSVLPEENCGQVADFLAAAPNFTAVHSTEIWRAQFGDAHGGCWRDAGSGVLLTPHTTGTDGFFVSVMTRA
jgi:16S rRNA (cytosine967-C5)-methyltransferase